MVVLCFVYIVLLVLQNVISCDEVPLVETNVGAIKGLKAEDGDYYKYMGIPYGQVDPYYPFGPALPYPAFEGIFEAFDNTALCPQVNEDKNNTIMGTLDCLHLNIYVPSSANTSNRVPVMVWLYGGGFRYGNAGKFGPSFLVQHDVILVTLNYRIGPYGFMCLDIPEVTGNQGLKDQYLAFKWIKDNIGAFGGDRDSITAFGQSAGGHSIDLHLMSPRETLFNKAILESGSAESLTVLFEPDKLAPIKLVKYIYNYETDDIKDALQVLSNISTDVVIEATRDLNIQFKPCVETVFDDSEPFIIKHWINLEPKVRNMPIMTGFNKDELASKDFPKDASFYRNLTIVNDHLEQVFKFRGQVLDEMVDLVSDFYFGDEILSEKLKWDVIRFDSDFTYIHPVHRTMQKYINNGAGNIYFYRFSYVGGRNELIVMPEEQCRRRLCCTSHMDDVAYIFDIASKPRLTPSDQIVVQRITTMWTNFAKYSDPTPQVTELLPIKWIPVTRDTYYCLNIDKHLTLIKRPLHSRMAFWDLFYKYNKKYQKGYEN